MNCRHPSVGFDSDTRCVMASLFSSSSDSESSTTLDDDLQGSDDIPTQSEGLASDSDDDYLVENDGEASSDDQYDSDGDNEDTPASPTPHTFTLMADPFSDHRPGTVPATVEDFSGVHPDIPRGNISALDCFQLFMSDEVVESLCLWTNVRAAKFFVDNPTISSKKFMGKKCSMHFFMLKYLPSCVSLFS